MVNVGNFDRLLRIILGAALLIIPFVTSFSLWSNSVFTWGSVVVGIVLLLTSAMKFCPLYYITGMRTCPVEK